MRQTCCSPQSGLIRVLSLLWVIVVLTACHTYEPMIGETPAPGDDVRVRLSGSAAEDLSRRVGREIRSVEGKVLHAAADSLRVDAGFAAIYAGTAFQGRRDTLTFKEGEYLEVDRRELSRSRTALVAAGVVAAVVALFTVRGGGSDPGGRDRGGDTLF